MAQFDPQPLTQVFEMRAAFRVSKIYSGCGPRLNKPGDPQVWLKKGGAPWATLANEPKGVPVTYDELTQRWTGR